MPLHQALAVIVLCSLARFCSCTDMISSTLFIKDPETIVSNSGVFKLGFFTPVDSNRRYAGVLYNLPVTTAVWVANRDVPLSDTSGTITISGDQNLVVLDGQNEIIWSSNISNAKVNSTAQLLDTGNLVLWDNSSGAILWESFQNPSDSYLPNMRLSAKNRLISWKSPSDPSIGMFSVGLGPVTIPELFLWNGSQPFWRSGPWNGQVFTGIPDMNSAYNNGFHLADANQGNPYVTFNFANNSIISYFFLDSNGSLMQKHWNDGRQDWEVMSSSMENTCNAYGKCGPFGICDLQDSRICRCLRGFEPRHMEDWNRGNWTSGCIRRAELQCGNNRTTGENGKSDGFVKLSPVKVPDHGQWLALADSCGSNCLKNCSCVAYSYDAGIGCMHWSSSLIDTQKFSTSSGVDFYIRVANSELDKKRDTKTIIVAVTVIVLSITIAVTTYICWRCMAKRIGKGQETEMLLSGSDNINQVKFEFEKLASATGNFHQANKLGQGGFGPVYKGVLPDGREIAVKRLSRSSDQGLEEFMNEVMVISQLQHRNLVKLLGCCVEGDEKMLIYEYMPNRSLDAHLFDPIRREQLIWCKRSNIIEGIARGLLYLHRDSRLRIIHRDMKASNILLDDKLNPKISDFGMARIFGGNQDQENTRRVVGTYGYMPPEYAMGGIFSEKSDVYSFGVLMLEIISGRRNTSFYNDQHALSLLGLAWKLWNDEKSEDLIDPWIIEQCLRGEILRYIHVGLLCVQELAKDRPTVSDILRMLSSENENLPKPKQPAFIERQTASEMDFQKRFSVNNVSITILQGR